MKTFAEVENGIVVNVFVANDDFVTDAIEYTDENPAAIGYSYDI